ncbi:MAG: helix-turn-helix transcriptional regulator [Pyrinomonadaceae bacterium]
MGTELDKRFFESTRGRMILSLRGSSKTVNELAAELGLTDNAVRAHLLSLERDRLVEQGGLVKGHRKPHFSYRLTDEASHLFPKSYHSLLNRLLDVLRKRFSDVFISDVLSETGRNIGESDNVSGSLDDRVDVALAALANVGGAAVAVRSSEGIVIESDACPFADSVSEHPEVCKLTEAMIEEIVGLKVVETCDRKGSPKCRFQINAAQPELIS